MSFVRRFGLGVLLGVCCLGAAPAALIQPLTITGYVKVSEVRETRTVSLFTYRAKLTNTGAAITGATATVVSLSPAATIVDASLTFGPVASGGTVESTDTFSFRQNRTVAFAFSSLQWTVTPNAPVTFALTVTRTGTGDGAVTSAPAGINCGATCATSFDTGTSVTLTAAPNATSIFAGWSGSGCSGTGTCVVPMNAARAVTATFTLQPVLTGISFSTDTDTIAIGAIAHLTATAHYSDGSSQNVTASTSWLSFDPSVAAFDAPGVLRGVSAGGVDIELTFGGFTEYGFIDVLPTLLSISVEPASPFILALGSQQFTATGMYSDGSDGNVTSSVIWSSSNPAIATVNASGLAQGTSTAGETTIGAAIGSISGSATLTVVSADTRFLYSSAQGGIQGYAVDQATGGLTPVPGGPMCFFGDCRTPFTRIVQDPLGRFLFGAIGSQIHSFRIAPGTGVLTRQGVLVPGGQPRDLAVDPTGRFLFALESNSPTVAAYAIDADTGLLTPAGAPVTTGGAAVQRLLVHPSGHFLYLAGEDGTVAGVAVDPVSGVLTPLAGSSIVIGPLGDFEAFPGAVSPSGAYLFIPRRFPNPSPGTVEMVTLAVDPLTGALSLVSTAPLPGRPSSTPAGTSVPLVQPSGQFLHVLTREGFGGPDLSTFAIDAATGILTALPDPLSLPTDGIVAATLTPSGDALYLAGYGDTSISRFAIDTATGVVTPAGGPFGDDIFWFDLVMTNGAAPAPAPIVSIEIIPSDSTTLVNTLGGTYQFTLVGHASDDSTRFLTHAATWSSSDESVAVTVPGGLAVEFAYGHTTISATYGSLTTSTGWTIAAPALVSIAVTPGAPTLAFTTGVQLQAIGTYSDASTLDITTMGTWSSSNDPIATADSSGFLSTAAPGTATIQIALDSVVGSVPVTVVALTPTTPRFLYSNAAGGIQGYVVDQATGALTPVPGGPMCFFGDCRTSFQAIVQDPLGRFLFGAIGSQIHSFRITPGTGVLTRQGVLIPGGQPRDLAVDPTGRFLFMLESQGSTVLAFTIDADTGLLTPAGAPVTTGGAAVQRLLVHPSGHFLYLAGEDGTVAGVAVDPVSGVLTPLAGSPIVIGPLGEFEAFPGAVSPSGAYLFIPRRFSNPSPGTAEAEMVTLAVDLVTGALSLVSTAPLPGRPSSTPAGTSAPLVQPSGQFLHVLTREGFAAPDLSTFAIDAATGILTALPDPLSLPTDGIVAATLTPSGDALYLAGYGDTGIRRFAIDTATGAVTPAGGLFGDDSFWSEIVVTNGVIASTAAIDSIEIVPSDATTLVNALGGTYQFTLVGHASDGSTRFLTHAATWSSSDESVAVIVAGGLAVEFAYGHTTISATYGSLMTSTGWTIAAPALVSIAVTPSSPTLAATTGVQLQAIGTFSDASTLDITTIGTWSSSNESIATVHSAGFVNTAFPGTATIQIELDGVVGSVPVTVVALLATTPRYLYSSTGQGGIQGYVVDQATGALTRVPGASACFFGNCQTPFEHIVQDPLGRFLFGSIGSQIHSFAIAPGSGVLTLQQLFVPGGSARDLAIDPTGRFLYMLDAQNPTILVLAIDASTGVLTPVGGPAPTAGDVLTILIDPSGRFLYQTSFNEGTVAGMAIDPVTGVLTPLPGGPLAIGEGFGANAYPAAVSTSGAFLFVPRFLASGGPGTYDLATVAIDPVTGALSLVSSVPLPGSPSAGPSGVSLPLVQPSGLFLHLSTAATVASSTLTTFAINAVTGALTALPDPLTILTYNIEAMTLTPSGDALYLTGFYDQGISHFAIDPVTGVVTPAGGPFGNDTYWFGLVVIGGPPLP